MKIKVCGMKFQENISEIGDLKPEYMGFIFYSKSSRFIGNSKPVVPKGIRKVGVFVNESVREIIKRKTEFALDVIQLHGTESSVFLEELKLNLPDTEIWKVFGIKGEFDFKVLEFFQAADKFLFDTKGKSHGGNGEKFNWEILRLYNSEKGFVLSGGIDIEDVEEIKKYNFEKMEILDINSRFEVEPGLKDAEKVRKFIDQFKN